MKTIGVVVGSLRKEAFSKKVAEEISKNLKNEYNVKFIEIGALEMFNQDFDDEGNTPASWVSFREEVKNVDAYLFVTPEYNRSVPPVLKNALDIASRPYGQNVWSGKPGAVASVSPGAIGGFGANHHLRQILAFLNVYTMQQPEMYLGSVMDSLEANGEFKQATKDFIKGFADAFGDWVKKFN